MDNAHLDFKSQNYFSIKPSESTVDWSDLYKIKLILRQPSPNWEHFGIDEITIVSANDCIKRSYFVPREEYSLKIV